MDPEIESVDERKWEELCEEIQYFLLLSNSILVNLNCK